MLDLPRGILEADTGCVSGAQKWAGQSAKVDGGKGFPLIDNHDPIAGSRSASGPRPQLPIICSSKREFAQVDLVQARFGSGGPPGACCVGLFSRTVG